MELFFQQLLNGLTVGSVYSLVALGLTLVFGILHVPNFAHGALYMVGAYVALTVMTALGINYWLAIAIAVVVVAFLSILMERLVFSRLDAKDPLPIMIAAIGMLFFLESFAQYIWGSQYQRMVTPYGDSIQILGLTVTIQRILVIVAAVLLMILLHLFLTRTMTGAAIIAMSQNRSGAFLVGIHSSRVAMMTFAIAGGLAAAAAALSAPINLVFPSMGNLVIMKAFVIIIIGGMGSIPGAIIGGYILGMAESLGATYLSADYKDLIAFFLLVLILTLKPTGLFAKGVK
ncbi:branched-chain amino acid ABC transporter permease [Halalkalibacter alkalisediminis]|uniref:Branched-chain amino acid ABC transporter permease n=1 Tax=Halalkalibacter alkalisediminis TaxID=935616 RepID=A0ABV6NB74_9BACI|nr:branched-chain amino acid ABC transporter permease [Halalkalibacter alkalisediminis]